jgi:Ca2+-binding RTX toxin-like protein
VPNAGFVAVAFTSETDVGRVLFCLDAGTGPGQPEDAAPSQGCDPGSAYDSAPDDSGECASVPAGASCWSAFVDPPDDAQFSLGMIEQDDPTGQVSSGEGDCEGDTFEGGDGGNDGDDCQLDKIYATSLIAPPSGPACPGAGGAGNQIVGTEDADVLRGTSGRDVICGLGGKDVMRGVTGNDVLVGGRGNDKGAGGPGKDRLVGGPGRDRLGGGPKRDALKGGPKNDRLNGGPGIDACRGGPGRDRQINCER